MKATVSVNTTQDAPKEEVTLPYMGGINAVLPHLDREIRMVMERNQNWTSVTVTITR